MAMHVVASEEYLDCEDLVPAACESINVDVSLEELLVTNGYGCIALLAYDVEGISGLEFALQGWPTGRGAPALDGPYWCFDGATTFGDHLDGGGGTGLGECAEPDSSGLVLVGYFYFGPVDSSDVPINFNFIPSTYTEPEDSILAVTDCTEDFVADEVVAWNGCTVGGSYSGTDPECGGGLDGGGEGGMAQDDSGSQDDAGGEPGGGGVDSGGDPWASAKFCGPSVQYIMGLDTLLFYVFLKGIDDPSHEEIDDDYTWLAKSGSDTIHMEYADSVMSTMIACSGAATIADTNVWEFHGQYKDESPKYLGQFEIRVDRIRRAARKLTAAQRDSAFLRDEFELYVSAGAIYVPPGQPYATFSRTSVPDSALYDAMYDGGEGNIDKIYPISAVDDGYIITLSSDSDDIFGQTGDLLHCGAVAAAGVLANRANFDPALGAPNDSLLLSPAKCCLCHVEADSIDDHSTDDNGQNCDEWVDIVQWVYKPETDYAGAIDAYGAWGWDTISNDIVVGVADDGVWWPHPAFPYSAHDSSWGADTSFVRGTYDYYDNDELGMSVWRSHGTAMAGLIAAKTNDNKDMASTCWGNIHLAAYRVLDPLFRRGWDSVYVETKKPGRGNPQVLSCSFLYLALPCSLGGIGSTIGGYSVALSSMRGFVDDSLCIINGAGNEDYADYGQYWCDESPGRDHVSSCFALPAAYPWIESITSVNERGTDERTFFHGNCGADPYTQPYGWIDLGCPPGTTWELAPAFKVCTTSWDSCKYGTDAPRRHMFRYGKTGWTSASTAIASGVAASVIDAYMDNPAVPGNRPIPEDVFGIMEHTAGNVGHAGDYDSDYPNYHVGWGKINMARAVFLARYGTIAHRSASFDDPNSGWAPEDTVFSWPPPEGFTSFYTVPYRFWHVVETGASGGTKACWGHHRLPTTGTMRLGEAEAFFFDDEQNMVIRGGYKWCDPSPSYHRGASTCTLNTYIYHSLKLTDPPGLVLEDWAPVPPESVVISYSVLTGPPYGGVDAGSIEGAAAIKQKPILDVYPQPFNPDTRLRFVVPANGSVSITIYDVLGRKMRTLVSEEQMASGIYFVTWDGKDDYQIGAASGVYFCRLTTNGQTVVRKLVLVR